MFKRSFAAAVVAIGLLVTTSSAQAFKLAIIAFQMSSETHARVANAAAEAGKKLGWTVQILNSEGSLPKHAEQIEAIIQAKPDGLIIAMGKPIEADAQLAAARKAGIPVITTVAGTSPHTLFDIQVNDYQIGAQATLYLLSKINYSGAILTERFENNVASRIRGKVLDVVLSENPSVKVLGSHAMARTASWREDVRSGMQALILAPPGPVPGDLGVVRRAGLRDRRPAARAGPEERRRRAGQHRRRAGELPPDQVAREPAHRDGRHSLRGDRPHRGREDERHRGQEDARRNQVVNGPYLWMDAVLVDRLERRPDAEVASRRFRRLEPLLRLVGIGKRYGAVEALRGIDLDVAAGEVLAICGDNGAGKSTLIRIVSGAHEPSEGSIEIEGRPAVFGAPIDALRAGVATIYQDLALASRLPIWQNVFVGAELTRRLLPGVRILDKRAMRETSSRYLARLKIDVSDTDRAVERLSGGQRQAVAIARALHWNARLVIMDEPTAALGVAETRQVHELIGELHRGGTTVVLISHNMAEVVAVATRVIVLKGGRKIADRAAAGLSAEELAHLVMMGPGSRRAA